MEKKQPTDVRARVALLALQQFRRVQEAGSMVYSSESWRNLLPVAMPSLDPEIGEGMISAGYTQVASAYFRKAFSTVAWEEERCEMRVVEVHAFKKDSDQDITLHIVREVREVGEEVTHVAVEKICFQQNGIEEASLYFSIMGVPIDLQDPRSFVHI